MRIARIIEANKLKRQEEENKRIALRLKKEEEQMTEWRNSLERSLKKYLTTEETFNKLLNAIIEKEGDLEYTFDLQFSSNISELNKVKFHNYIFESKGYDETSLSKALFEFKKYKDIEDFLLITPVGIAVKENETALTVCMRIVEADYDSFEKGEFVI